MRIVPLRAAALSLVLGLAGPVAGLFATPLAAQTTTPAPAAPPAAPPAAALTPAHLALAAEVVKLSGMSRSIDLVVPQMVERARALFVKGRPELAGELEKSIQTLRPEFEAQNVEAQRIAATAFGSRLPEAELQELKTFFSSPVGRKFVESQPLIIDDMFRNLDTFSLRLSQLVVDKLREDMKKKGHTL